VFTDANKASENGNWAEYGRKLEELEKILNQLNILINGEQQNQEEAAE
jgi:flagellin-specific chaperone FliS